MGDLPGHGQQSSPALRVDPWLMALSSQMAEQRNDIFGGMAEWQNGGMAEWWKGNGTKEEWHIGGMARRWNGTSVEWHIDGMA